MKHFNTIILFVSITLLLIVVNFSVQEKVFKRGFRGVPNFIGKSIEYSDSTASENTDFRRTNYEIIAEPVYTSNDDTDFSDDSDDHDYDRSYYGGSYTGGSYSGGK